MLRREFLRALCLLHLLYSGKTMGKNLKVLGCTIKDDRLYRVEPHRMLFQWIKEEEKGVYSVGMMSLLAALSYPLYSIKVKPIGTRLVYDDNLATVEAGKRIATFPTPLSGKVVAVNEEAVREPELVNRKPYTCWIAKIKITRPKELKKLQRAEEISAMVKEIIINEGIDCAKVEE